MARKPRTYQRLPGKKKGFLVGSYTLWQARDHLLHIYSRFGVEDYKRFYWADIQALITRKTLAGKIQNIIMGGFCGFFALLTLLCNHWGAVCFGVLSGTVLVLILVNALRGPTCETHILTAIQTEKLPSLHRLKTAQKVMDRLRPLIEQVQGRMPPSALNQNPVRRTATGSAPAPRPAPGKPRRRMTPHTQGRAHWILFVLLVFEGLLGSLGLVYHHVALGLLKSVVGISLAACVIIALVKQYDRNLKGGVSTVTWVALGYVGITLVVGYIVGMGIALRHPEVMHNQWELLKALSNVSLWESPFLLGFSLFNLCGAFGLGISGLVLLKRAGRMSGISFPRSATVSRSQTAARNPEAL
ncbi:MAG: hypothetical protein JSW39_24290 [Desulfobacterales bacterium]|nr:MAG: hypothetical protein JSW39_24290 [Desulfobacterales bacterium]